LTESNGVFASGNAIELLELRLLDALFNVSVWFRSSSPSATYLRREIDFNGFDADVLWSGGHVGVLVSREKRGNTVSEKVASGICAVLLQLLSEQTKEAVRGVASFFLQS